MTDYKALLRSMLSSQTWAAGLTISSFAVLVVLTRSTEVATFGQYAVLIGTVTMFTKFAGLNIYFHYRNRYPLASYEEALAILRKYLPFVLASGVVIATVTAAANVMMPFLPLRSSVDYALWAVLVVLSLLNLEIVRFYQAIGRNVFSLWLGTAAKVSSLVLFALCALTVGGWLELRTILVVLIGAQAAALLFQLLLDRPFVDLMRAPSAPFEWRAVPAGLILVPAILFYEALNFFDRLSLSAFLGYEAAGHYSLAAQGVVIAYSILGGTLITLFYPKLVRSKQDGPASETRRVLRFVFMMGTLACLAGAAAILLFADLITVIFDARYVSSIAIVRMMCLVPLCLFVLSALAHLAYLFDELKWSALAFVVGCITCVALNFGLISTYGIPGAVAALYLSLLFVIALHVGLLARRSSTIHAGEVL